MRKAAFSIGSSAVASDDVLRSLPIPVIVIGADGLVALASQSARLLFPTVDPIGLSLAGLLALVGAAGGDLPARLADGAQGRGRVQLQDGRVLDLQFSPGEGGRTFLTLFDVSAYIHEAQLATKDPLTGLLNRVGFMSHLAAALAATERSGAQVSVLCIDLDRFKTVNDTLGHPVGDALLVKVAERMRSASRKGEVIARMGGDEFAIIQQQGDQPRGSEGLAARLVDLIGRAYVVSGHSIAIGASVGVALSGAGVSAEELIKRADLALYRAKSAGRGQFSFFEPEMDAAMQRRRLLELDLRRALALREFELAFQPQYDLANNSLTGFEALLRWQSASRGMVSPAEFIPLAEEIGLMIPIGEWVMREACKQAAAWPEAISVAVNLSAHQFQNPRLVATVASALANAGLDPTRLELEITESALLNDTDAVLAALQGIRGLGVKISMDDFGTGYSSLSYLQKFPFHKIKIDQSFVRRMEQDAESKAIVRAVAALGASLGMTTTAEGVETPEQFDLVRAEGCTHVQGYLTGKPMTGSAASALLTNGVALDIPGVVHEPFSVGLLQPQSGR